MIREEQTAKIMSSVLGLVGIGLLVGLFYFILWLERFVLPDYPFIRMVFHIGIFLIAWICYSFCIYEVIHDKFTKMLQR